MVNNQVCKLHVGQHPPTFLSTPPDGPPQTPFPLDEKTKGNIRTPEGSIEASVSYQAYGFGLGSVSCFNI
jgi:hypothetical protein